MKSQINTASRWLMRALTLVSLAITTLLACGPRAHADQPTPAASAAFNAYAAQIEARLAQQHRCSQSIPLSAQQTARLRAGETIIARLTPSTSPAFDGAMLHHWRGTAFVPGATSDQFDHVMRDFASYPARFSPQVLRARVLSQHGEHFQVTLRVRQQHVLTVVLDTTYDVVFTRVDAQHGSSTTRSTSIAEVASPGTPGEHPLDAQHDHGFLWRQNTYWTYEQRDGGLYIQVESVSLSRSIPHGLAWAVGPYVESVPRESLAFTLVAVCKALRR